MISPNMIMQGKLPENFQSVKGQKNDEASNGIFGTILKALQADEDESGKNLHFGMNSGESENESENESETKPLLTLSTLTNSLKKDEAEGESANIDENSEGAENKLANDLEVSDETEEGTLTEVTDQSLENSADESTISNTETLNEETVKQNSVGNDAENKKKIVEESGQKTVSEREVNSTDMNEETVELKGKTSDLQSEKPVNSQPLNENVEGKQNLTESAASTESGKSDPSIIQKNESINNRIAGLSNGINPDGLGNVLENSVTSENKLVSDSKSSKSPIEERTALQDQRQPVQLNDTARNRGAEQLISSENGEKGGRITQAPDADTSSEESRNISIGQILQSGSNGVTETGLAGAAINSKNVNIDRLREEKVKKTSERILNNTSFADQTRKMDTSEKVSSKSLSPFSGGQDFENLDISSGENSSEESILFWNRLGYEGSESLDDKKSNSLLFGLSRLSHIPILNTTIRQQLLNGIAESVQKSNGSGNTAETWQKHTFSLENGKNVQISVRQTEGVLHLKLGSTNSELTKLLQLNQQEIKAHLQKEFDIEVDLEFNHQDEDNSSDWFESMQGQKTLNRGYNASSTEVGGKMIEGQTAGRTVRSFGYNQMEWTA